MKNVILLHGVIIGIRFTQSAIEVSQNFEYLDNFAIDTICFFTFKFTAFNQIFFMDKGDDVTLLFNRFVKYYGKLQGGI